MTTLMFLYENAYGRRVRSLGKRVILSWKVYQEYINGSTIEQLSKKYKVTPGTIERRLKQAKHTM
jgi:Mor family transcriptional regulator